MFDMHYDLLTIIYVFKNNKNYLKQIENNINNLKGVVANLYFMNKKEMKEELNINKINVIKMFKETLKILKASNIKTKLIFSIEGCDYIKNEKELEKLNKLGLKAILPVWNNKNQYGSGIRTNKGLTKKGKKIIQKAIDLNMAIDLSHANKKTYFDIIKIIKKQNKKVICYASHSNIYKICKNKRNLNIKQIKALKNINGYLGIVSYPPFLSKNKEKTKLKYIENIKLAIKLMGIDNVVLSTDNMDFYNKLNNKYEKNLFNYKNVNKEIKELLNKYFTKKQIDKLMFKNAEKIYNNIYLV